MGAPPQPGRPGGGPPPGDQLPSPRIATAVRMLRNGHHPAQVAAVTDVPFALVELILEHLPAGAGLPGHPDPPTVDPRDAGRGHDTDLQPTRGRGDTVLRAVAAQQQTRQRRRIRILRGAVICTVLSTALGAVAVFTHMDTLARICLSLTPLTYLVVLLLLIFQPLRVAPHRPHRR